MKQYRITLEHLTEDRKRKTLVSQRFFSVSPGTRASLKRTPDEEAGLDRFEFQIGVSSPWHMTVKQ